MRKLKLFNGRWWDGEQAYAFIAAYSRADAIRVITEYFGFSPRGIYSEIRDYWNEGCWGNSMDGIEPTRGLWVVKEKQGSVPQKMPPKKVKP